MNYGIPTTYNGVRFRSRTEARWAAFFDAIGWNWAYEPLDLRGYIPDFLVWFDTGRLLVEVKADTSLQDLAKHKRKIEDSGWREEAAIVGASLMSLGDACPVFGLIGTPVGDVPEETHEWGEARLFRCLSCGDVSVLSSDYSWHCRRCGTRDGHVGESRELWGLWASACNRVQWRPDTPSVAQTCRVTRDVTTHNAAVTTHVTRDNGGLSNVG